MLGGKHYNYEHVLARSVAVLDMPFITCTMILSMSSSFEIVALRLASARFTSTSSSARTCCSRRWPKAAAVEKARADEACAPHPGRSRTGWLGSGPPVEEVVP